MNDAARGHITLLRRYRYATMQHSRLRAGHGVQHYRVIERRYMYQYNDHPIYGIAVRGAGKEWYCRGLIFDPADKVTEIKRLECAELTFATKRKAEAHGLKLCKTWIDEQSGPSESSSLTLSAPQKAGASAI